MISKKINTKKLKVLLCSLYGRSAMLQYSSQLANALSRYADTYVLIPDYSDTVLFNKDIRFVRIKAPPNMLRTAMLTLYYRQFSQAIAQIKKINPDIIHVTDNHPWYLILLNAFKDKTLFVTQHDVTSHPGEFFRGKVTIVVNKALNKHARRVIVHGNILKKELSKTVDKKKILVYPHGDYSFFLKWRKKNVKEEPHTILFFGRIVYYKGLDILLKAVPLIVKKVPDFKVIIAGDGDLRPYIQFMTPSVMPHLEIMNKYFAEKDIPILFQRSSIVVMPYREASQSGVIPIAYAFKKAVVCTEVGAIPEVVDNKKTGILIKPGSEEILAETIVMLIKNSSYRRKLGVNGYHKMCAELSWNSIAQRLVKEYVDAIIEHQREAQK